jgi:hypothetical protein
MFVLPALILPLVFGLAIYRLYQIPRRLWLGELRLPGKQRAYLSTATVAAYLALLSYTIGLGAALVQALFVTENRMPAYLSLVVYMAAYPLVYVGAAWVFYYGLKSRAVLGH